MAISTKTRPNYIYGINEAWLSMPFKNLPKGAVSVRLKMRINDFARAFVKTGGGVQGSSVQEWCLIESDGALMLAIPCGENLRVTPTNL